MSDLKEAIVGLRQYGEDAVAFGAIVAAGTAIAIARGSPGEGAALSIVFAVLWIAFRYSLYNIRRRQAFDDLELEAKRRGSELLNERFDEVERERLKLAEAARIKELRSDD